MNLRHTLALNQLSFPAQWSWQSGHEHLMSIVLLDVQRNQLDCALSLLHVLDFCHEWQS